MMWIQVHRLGFNPRAPRGARRHELQEDLKKVLVSIHAPHAGRDSLSQRLPTLMNVSIHAPHAGRDRITKTTLAPIQCFNPRAPRGARLRAVEGHFHT